MPGVYSGNGRTLIAVIYVVPASSSFSFVQARFSCDQGTWETTNASHLEDYGLYFHDESNGPLWEINTTVTVVIKFLHNQINDAIFLKTQGIINQTW